MDTSRLIVQDVRIFDGITDRLSNGHVLVEGRTIAAVDTSPIAADAGQQRIVELIETRIDEQDR